MIDRPLLTPGNGYTGREGAGRTVLVDLRQAETATTRTLEDGSVEVLLGPAEERLLSDAPFGANLADYLAQQTLQSIANDIRFAVDDDKSSRKEWEDALSKGMDLLGIKQEDRTIPWPGACGITHPMILEAAVRFQSKSITRLFPPEGPATAKVIGGSDEQKIQCAKRVATDLNYWLTEKMAEYRDETEQLLFALPIDGSAFKKVFYDPLRHRPVAQFVPASDFVLPYGFPNLETCPRYTHLMRKSYAEIARLQKIGFYREILLTRSPINLDQIEEKQSQLSGMHPSYTNNDLLNVWESTCELDLEDFGPASYVVTLVEDSPNSVLAIHRNWKPDDPDRTKVLSWTHYRYVPWKGAYGLGLIHLIGGISKGTTSILRQLVDAGTLSNLPGGLKSNQMRIKGENTPINPGEFRDVDVPAGRILDSIAFIPYKEPSAVLFQLFQGLVDEGKSFASIAELDISSSTQNAPVGTMLALIERATEVQTAVQSRLHIALARELALIAEIIRDNTSPEYDYDPANQMPRSAKQADYQETAISIIPVSDPAASTMAQRVMTYQAALQTSAQAPQLYNLPLLHRSLLEVLGVDNADQIVPDKSATEPMDPVAENMALLTSKPVKAYEWQDHQSHLQVHMTSMQDPKLMQALQQNPLAPSIQSAAFTHICEHLAFLYRSQMEQQLGVPLPPLGSKLPPEVESQLSPMVAQAAQKLLQQNQAMAQQQQNQQQAQDPVVQQQQAELQLKQQQVQQKGQTDQAKLQLEQQRISGKQMTDIAKMHSDERMRTAEIQAENLRHGISEHAETHRTGTKEHAATTRELMGARLSREKIASDEERELLKSMPPEPGEGQPPAQPGQPPMQMQEGGLVQPDFDPATDTIPGENLHPAQVAQISYLINEGAD